MIRVGIVSWNSAPHLDRCLAALPAALEGAPTDVEVVVVDNGSSDKSLAVARRHAGVRVIENRQNRGYARAMNQALAGDAEVLVALNPDTDPPRGSLAQLAMRLLADPGLGLVVPRLVKSDGGQQPSVYRFPSPAVSLASSLPRSLQRGELGARLWLESGARYDRSTDIDWAIGAVHVIRAKALGTRRPYCERWFMYGEDMELCWRLREGGWRRRLEAEIAVTHVGDASGAQAWGSRRELRWLPVAYDAYRLLWGGAAMRRWAVANAAAGAGIIARQVLAAPLARSRGQRLRDAGGLLRILPLHLRAALAGPPPPGTGPPVAGGGPKR